MRTRLSSATKEVFIGDGLPTVLIGERINPTGKKRMSEALRTGNLELVCDEARTQVRAGADVLDVNINTFGVDEVSLLPQAVKAVMETVDVPLCIDSSNPKALEAAMSVYKGKPLINSVTGEERSLGTILPLVNAYGAAVIGLTQDDEGIPGSSERRVAIAHRIVERAEASGVPREDVIIDSLCLAVGADTSSGLVTLETIRRIKDELGINLTLGVGNISFGLPDRNLLNGAFLAVAIATGVNCPIVDVEKIRPIVLATDLVLGLDRRGRRYTDAYRQRQCSGG